MSAQNDADLKAPSQRVKLTIVCGFCEATRVYYDSIDEKYPFWCYACDNDLRTGKYPWALTADIVDAADVPDEPDSEWRR